MAAERLTAPVRRRLSWVVWGIGAGVYVLAVFHRTSMGVVGPQAVTRFSLSAAQLGSFVMLQLGIYAVMQVPTGIMVDRYGPRRMLLAATSVMGLAQLAFALVHTYPLALLARGLLGCGDAMTYISVLRLVAGWFPARRYAVLASFTGLLGSLGNLIATLPLTALLQQFGWTATFAVAGSVSLGYALLLLRPATRAPFRQVGEQAGAGAVAGHRVWNEVKQAWRLPAGRLGFWVHLTTMAGPVAFGVLWGYPYLTAGLGYSPASGSALLMLLVVGGLVANLTIGLVVSRRPVVRTPIAVLVVVACLIGWLVLIGWPGGRPPAAVVVLVVLVFSVGGPASTVGFLLARDYSPRHRISTATGMVNVGGFCGAVAAVYLVGQILDLVDANPAERSLTAFRWAFVAIAVLTAAGLTRMLTWWLRTRAVVLLAAARGESVPVQITAHRWELVDAAILAQEASRAREAREQAERDGADQQRAGGEHPEPDPTAASPTDGAGTGGSVTDGPGTGTSVTGGPGTGTSVTDGLVTDGPITGGSTTDGPVADGPVTDGPVADGPVTGGSTTDGPVTGREMP
jgi:sugar phosphate permease